MEMNRVCLEEEEGEITMAFGAREGFRLQEQEHSMRDENHSSEKNSRSAEGDLVEEGNGREPETGTEQRNEPVLTARESPLKRNMPPPDSPPPFKKYSSRVQNCTPNPPDVDVKIKYHNENSIRIVFDEDGKITDCSFEIPEKNSGGIKVKLRYHEASGKLQIFSKIVPPTPPEGAATNSDSSQVEEEMGKRNKPSLPAGGKPLKRSISPPKKLPCRDSNCTKSFASRGSERIHYHSVHLGTKYVCNLCQMQFEVVSSMYKHLKKAHEEEARTSQKKTLFHEVSRDNLDNN